MHESLHLKNISRIRGSLRSSSQSLLDLCKPLAETAAAGSAEHVLMLQLRTSQLSDAQAVLLLPVIFLHLDPAGIPEIDELDGLISLTSAMDGAIAAFMTLGKIRHTIPPAASLDIWSRLWPWIDFFHLYWKNLPRLCKEDEAEATPLHVFIILTLAMHERTRDIICSTGGVRRVLAMGWKALVYSDSPPLARIAEIVYLLTVVSNQGRDFDEIVEGVGGNVEDLAAVVLKQIPDAYAREKSDLVGRLICACLSLFGEVQGEGAAFLFDAALESALVPTLISAILAIHGTPAGIAVQSCLLYLITSLQYRFGAHTVQALEAGLLRVILVVGGSPTKRSIEPGTHAATTAKMIAGLLEEILPKALVHYDVVLNMKQSFGRAEALASSTGITKSPLAKEWQEFSVMAKKRLSLLESWEERSKVSFMSEKSQDECNGWRLIRRPYKLVIPDLASRSEERGKGNYIDTFPKLHWKILYWMLQRLTWGKGPDYHHPTATGHDSRDNGDGLRLGLL
ncbi:hypothetical protein B0H11DRAFT_2366118 [Mycena galericulata]|nr:hypothetical protein B0H11DRAFT_2375510 [Mycena galericulata]KAJ7436009.1 hypothetical protein B0H11DRAFT_2366118 [Mycena galericulata]